VVLTRGARAARGAGIAAFATLVASVAHTVGGGTAPGPLAVVLSLAFSAPLAMVLTGPRMPLIRASAAALAAQAVLHLLYSVGAGGAARAASVAPHSGHDGTLALDVGAAAVAVDHGHVVGMPLAHLVAAALTVIALALVGRAVRAVAAAFGTAIGGLRLLAAVLAGLPVATAVRHRVPVVRRDAPALALVLLSSLRHRGPPASPVAA
jgi:hypothetical protein